MENRVSSSFNNNNKNENISLSNNSSTCTTNSNSTRHRCCEYESSYPSMSRYRTSLSSSPYRKIHYLDDSDEEIINEEIIDITNIDHYPTLIERWGDDAKTIIKHDGEFIIEDYVEFEETEPTIMEEISYEIIYSDGQIKSTREVQHSYVEARNFSKIKKRRIKRKRSKLESHSTDINERAAQLLDEMRNLSSEIDSMIQTTNKISNSNNDLSGDNDEITTINRAAENIIKNGLNENSKTIPNHSNDCSNIEIMGNETLFSVNEQISLQSHNSNKQKPRYQRDLIPQRVDDDEKTRQSYLLVKNEHHILHNDHVTNSLAQSSINDDHENMLEFRLQSADSESNLEKKPSAQQQVQSIENDTQSTITIEHNFGQDQQSFIIQTNESISNIDSQNAISSNQLNKNIDADSCNDSTMETYEVTIEFEKEQISDQSFIRSQIDREYRLSNSNSTPSVMETKQDEFKHSSSTEIDANTLATSLNLQSSSDNFAKKQSPTSTSFVAQEENEPERLSSINHTMETFAQTQKPFLRSSIDSNQQGSTMNTTQDETIEHSSDVCTDKLRQIGTTYFPSIDNAREIIEETANDSINQTPLISTLLTSIDDNITTTLLSNEVLSDSPVDNAQFSIRNIISNESELLRSTHQDESFNDIDTKSFSSSQSIKFHDINTDSFSDPCNNLQQYADMNTADLITTDSCYSTHDLSSSSTESFTADSSFKTDFQDWNQSEYFITRNIEPISSEFPSVDIEESDKKTETSDLTRIYFELQEQRNNAPLHVYQEKSNDNHIGLKSFPHVTNLLSTEYHRVFGVSNDIINTVSDITKSVDVTFQSKDSNENKSIVIDDNQSIIPGVTSNLQLDFRYSSLLNRVDTLIQPLLNSLSINENESILANTQPLNERSDARMDYVNILDKATNSDQNVLKSSHNNESISQKNILSNDTTPIRSSNQSQIESNIISSQQTKTSMDDKISDVTEQIQNRIENIRHNTESIEQKDITTASSAFKFNNAVMPTPESIITPSAETKIKIGDEQNQQSTTELFVRAKDFLPAALLSSTPNATHKEPLQPIEKKQKQDEAVRKIVDVNDSSSTVTEPTDGLDHMSSIRQQPLSISNYSDNNKLQNTLTGTERTDDNTQGQPNRNIEQSLIPKCSSCENQSMIVDPGYDCFSSIQSTSTRDQQKQDKTGDKSSDQKFPTMYDDYPWYSSYYTIVDAETKLTRLYKQFNFINTQQERSPTTVHIQSDFDNAQEPNDDRFHVVQRRKRVSSSTTHTHNEQSTNTILSPDIDLEPVILRGHPGVPIATGPIISQTTDTVNKKKHKKKKKDDKETIFFDAPEFVPSDVNQEQNNKSQITEQLASMPIDSNKDESQKESNETAQTTDKAQDECQNKSSSQNTQLMSDFIDKQQQQQPSPITVNIQSELNENVSIHNRVLDKSSEQDDGEFHVVQRRKRIPSSNTQTQIIPTTNTTFSPDIDLEPVVLHGNPGVSIVVPALVLQPADTVSKKKHKKKKRDQKETFFFDAPEFVASDVTKQQNDKLHSELVERVSSNSTQTINSSDVIAETASVQDNKSPVTHNLLLISSDSNNHKSQEKFNESVQVIDNNQEHIDQNAQQSVTSKNSCYSQQPKIADSECQHLSSIHQTSIIDHRQQSIPREKPLCHKVQVMHDDYPWYPSHYTIVDAETKFARLYKELNGINKQQQLSTSTVNIQSELNDKLTTDEPEFDNERQLGNGGFHVVQRRKRVPSSTTQSQVIPTTNTTLSPDIDLEPVVLHGHPSVPIAATPPIFSQPEDSVNKKKTKKKKKDKQETILFDAPELISSDVSKQENDKLHSQSVDRVSSQNDETIDSSSVLIQSTITEQLSSIPINLDKDESLEQFNETVQILDNKQEQVTAQQPVKSDLTTIDDNNGFLSTTHLISTVDDKKQDECVAKSSDQKFRVTYDDYPWYSSYYSLADAEVKFAQLYKVLNCINEPQQLSTTAVSNQLELDNANEQENDGFHVVQRRKRVPSSTTQSQVIPTTNTTLSPDIDLEPVVLHGHPILPIATPPILLQPEDSVSKKKTKKKKKDKQETILFDAPELIPSDVNKQENDKLQSQLVERVPSNNVETIHSSSVFTQSTITEQLSSMPINLDKDESPEQFSETVQILDNKQEQVTAQQPVKSDLTTIHDNNGFLSTTHLIPTVDDKTQGECVAKSACLNVDVMPDFINKQQLTSTEVNIQSELNENVSTQDRALQNSTEQNDDEFHVVQRRKRIPSSTARTQGEVPTTATLSSDIDLEPVILHGHLSVPIATPRMTSSTVDTVSKKKHKKKKKDKQETIIFDAPEFVPSDKLQSQFVGQQCSTNIETVDSSNAVPKSETVIDDESVIAEQVLLIPINSEQDESHEHLNDIVQTLDKQQDQIIRPTQQSLIADSTNYSNQLANVNHSDDLLSSAQPTSAVDNEKQNTKSSNQNVQAMSDFISNQQLPPAAVTIQSELNEIVSTQNRLLDITREQDDDEFHVVQHRKCIPSSTTQTRSEILTTTALSSNIDLEPVVLHGHPDISIVTPPIDSQTVNATSKKKHKKKKKSTKEIFFDAPEILPSDINKSQQSDTRKSQSVKNQSTYADSSQTSLTIKPAFVPSEIFSTLTGDEQKGKALSKSNIANDDDYDDDGKNELTSDNACQSISTPVRAVLHNVKLISSSKVEQSIDNRSNVQPSPSSVIKTKTITTVESPKEDEDNEGFHPVHYHKRTLALPKPEKTTSASTVASKETHNADLDLTRSVIHENQNLSMPSTTITDNKTPKRKNTKQKKRKQEVASASNEQTAHEETTPILFSPIIRNSDVQPKPTLPSIVNIKKMPSPSEDDEEEEDNEGFQVVKYRKHSNTASQSRKVQQSSPNTKNSHEQYFNRKYLGPAERYDSASRPIPRNIPLRKTLSNKSKQDSYQTSTFTGSPRSASTDNRIITSTSVPNSFNKPKDMKQTTEQLKPVKNLQNQTIISTTPKPHQSSSTEQSSKPIVQEYHASTHTEKKTGIEKSTVLNITSTKTHGPKLIQDDDNDGFQLVRHQKNKTSTTAKQPKLTSPIDKKPTLTYVKQELSTITTSPPVDIEQTITPQEKSKKSKKNKEPTPPSPITQNSSPISITNDGQDQTANRNVQKIPQLPIKISNRLFSTEDKTISKPITNEIITSQANEQVHPTDNIQNLLTSTISSQEVSKSSNELPDEAEPIHISQTSSPDILRILNEPEEVVIKKSASTADIKHEQIKTSSNEKPSQRRKKQSRTATKADDTNASLSSTIATIEPDDDKQKLNSSTVQKSKIIESKAAQPQKSQQISTKKQHISNQNFETTELLTTAPSQSTPPMQDNKPYEVANSKLDLFLPDYIRQQINTRQTSSSLVDNSNMSSTTITSSDMIQKRKQRAKMLTKDHEAKSLLTNEFDTTSNNEKIASTDFKNVTDIDEFIIQTDQTNNVSSQQNIDNILSRGFNLWLHEGQALSQQKDKSKSNRNLTHTLQSIIVQPLATNDDVKDSYTTSQTMQSIFTADVRTEKRIHINNAYFINHPKSLSTPSCIENQSNEKKSDDDDDSRKYDEDNDEDSTNDRPKKQRFHQADRHVLTKDKRKVNSNNDNNLQINFSTDDVQRCLGEDFYHQLENNNINNNNNNNTINFDDWAHFLEQQNSQQIESNSPTSLECFYAETLDDDTLLSNSVPNKSSVPHQKPRYGDFSKSDHEIITPESMTKLPSCKSKPSDTFRRWRKPQSITNQFDNDDEVFISHSANGLCRQVTP
ncbi:unnamed protein product [Rotaria socialis]